MSNFSTLFFIIFLWWIGVEIMLGNFSAFSMFSIMVFSLAISFLSWKMRLISGRSKMLLLNIGFYRYLWIIFCKSIVNSFRLSYEFIRLHPKIDAVADFILIEKDSDEEIVLYVNAISFISGSTAILVRKRNIIIRNINETYLSRQELYDLIKMVYISHDERLVDDKI